MDFTNTISTAPCNTFGEQVEKISRICWRYRQRQIEHFLQNHRDKTKDHTLVRFQYDPDFVALVPTDYLDAHDGKLNRQDAEQFTFITLRDPSKEDIEKALWDCGT